MKIGELDKTLRLDGPFTLFAPTNEAFAAIPSETLAAVLADKPTLQNILLYHVTPGAVYAADVVGLDGQDVPMANGATVAITVDDAVMVNDANVIVTDISARNGVIHLIDAVLLP